MNGQDCIGTALSAESRVWYALSRGIIQRIHFPDADTVRTRELVLVVTDGKDFFSQEIKDTDSRTSPLEEGVPAFRVETVCRRGRYRIEKEILADPRRSAFLQRIVFTPQEGALSDYRLFVLLFPHLKDRGSGSTAWWGDYKGVPMLFAEYDDTALALASSAGWVQRSVGYAGSAHEWRELHEEKKISRIFTVAEDGNLTLLGEIDLAVSGGTCTIALGFGLDRAEAGLCTRASLLDGFALAEKEFLKEWKQWKSSLLPMPSTEGRTIELVPAGAAAMKSHESKDFPGGYVSSLCSPPDPFARPEDLAEIAGAFLAVGRREEFARTLLYLESTQEGDGHWPPEQWLDGTPARSDIRMEATALPILVSDLGFRQGALDHLNPGRLWAMVRKAAEYLLRYGPVTAEERWEDEPGHSLYALASEIAALLAAAEWADRCGEPEAGHYLRETADTWNANIDRWTKDAAGPDILALVRFGLRAPDAPRIADAALASQPALNAAQPGSDHALSIGKLAHYELAAGRRAEAERLLGLFESLAGSCGLFSRPRSHAEHIKLKRSLRDGRVFDTPPYAVKRYIVDQTGSVYAPWRFNQKIRSMQRGRILRIEIQAPALIHWTTDRWASMEDAHTIDTGLGMNIADLPTEGLAAGQEVEFTFYWRQTGNWENRNFTVEISQTIQRRP